MQKLFAFALATAGITAGLGLQTGSAAANCGTVSIAEMNWGSAGVAAQVDKFILEKGYGCNVDLVSGDTVPTFTSMNEKGQPDIMPELWLNAMRTLLDAATAEGRLVYGAEILADGSVEGWWIPKFIADANPEIKTVRQALERPDLFPAPEDPSKGAIYDCPHGWQCQFSTDNLYRALGGPEKNFIKVDTGSSAGFDGSVANAFERRIGWLGYNWEPTAMLGKYPMVRLSFDVEHDKEEWDRCTSVSDCVDPKVNTFPISRAFTIVTKSFAEKGGAAFDYVNKRSWDNATVNAILAWQTDSQGTNADTARHFLETREDVWTKWVSPEIADRIKAAL